MRKQAQNAFSLFIVLALAAVLTAVASGRVNARSTSQLSPPDSQSPQFPTATISTGAPVATFTPEFPTQTPTVPAGAAPVEITVMPVGSTPTVAGFLPAPTLTNPDELRSNPPAAYRPPPAPLEPTAEPAPTPVTLGGLVREGVVALSYLWLCTGVLLLIGVAAVIVWLVRRAPPSAP